MMKKTYLVGYYGMQNTGDDALLAATAWGARSFLEEQAGHCDYYVNTPSPLNVRGLGVVAPRLRHRQRFRAQNRLRQYATALASGRVIFGGGSVLHNARDINLKRDLMTLSARQGHLALGVGIGPFANLKAERACGHFLRQCDFVGVRDPESLKVALAIAPEANVKLTFDLAPTLLCQDGFHLRPLTRKGVAICLCPKERLVGDAAAEQQRLSNIALALNALYFTTGEPITFVDFNGHPELGDAQVHAEVAARLDTGVEFHTQAYDANPFRVLQRMAGFKAIVCMRLHAAIFGFMAETPVVSLAYHSKSDGWAEQIGMPNVYRMDAHNVDPTLLADALSVGLSSRFLKNQLSVSSAVNAAMLNWRKAYEYRKPSQYEHIRCYSPV